MSDLISRQMAIDALDCINGTEEVLRSLPSAQPEINCSEFPNNSDLISRQDAIDELYHVDEYNMLSVKAIRNLPSAQPETCEGCKHLGKWENEVEYGYPSPCTCCKRRAEDRYER